MLCRTAVPGVFELGEVLRTTVIVTDTAAVCPAHYTRGEGVCGEVPDGVGWWCGLERCSAPKSGGQLTLTLTLTLTLIGLRCSAPKSGGRDVAGRNCVNGRSARCCLKTTLMCYLTKAMTGRLILTNRPKEF